MIGLLLAAALPLPDAALELELLELPHAETAEITANASALATQLRKILISVSSAPLWCLEDPASGSVATRHPMSSRVAAGARPGPLTPTRCNRLQDHSRASDGCQLQSCAGTVKT